MADKEDNCKPLVPIPSSPVQRDESVLEEVKGQEILPRKQIIELPSPQEGIPRKRPKVDTDTAEDSFTEVDEVAVSSHQGAVAGPSGQSAQQKTLARGPIKSHVGFASVDGQEKKLSKPSNWDISNESSYQVKWVNHEGKKHAIVMQNENGPCPLIGIVNVLSLRDKFTLAEGTTHLCEDFIMSQIHNAIMESLPKETGEQNPNQLQNVQDALSLLPQMKSGLNVNVKFNGVKHFEYTPECIIFDVLNIPLYHGWLLDPQLTETMSAVGSQSYNQLVESIIEKKGSNEPDKLAEALVAESFLEETASQLTIHGLCELNASLNKGELAILFRNNHFSVLHKHEKILCQLVTDQGFLEEPDVVWETLSTINGDETFLNGAFENAFPQRPSPLLSPLEEQQISQDEELARQLLVEEEQIACEATTMPKDEGATESRPPSQLGQLCPSTPSHKEQEETSRSRDWKCCIS